MLINLKKEIKSLEQRAYEVIKEMILTGQLKPNARLTEEKMAKDLGVSRTTIQKAFIRLKNEYLLEGTPFKGVQVKSASLDEAVEAYEVRELLEGYASRIAVRDLDDKKLSKMIKGFEALEATGADPNGTEFQNLNYDFHMTIAGCYKNRAITKLIAALIMETKALHRKHQVQYFFAEGSLQQHLQILHAIKDRDEDRAEELTRKHLRNVRETFLQIIKKGASKKNPIKAGKQKSVRR